MLMHLYHLYSFAQLPQILLQERLGTIKNDLYDLLYKIMYQVTWENVHYSLNNKFEPHGLLSLLGSYLKIRLTNKIIIFISNIKLNINVKLSLFNFNLLKNSVIFLFKLLILLLIKNIN